MQLTLGSSFGRYTIESRLGEGGIGVVYLASDPVLGRRVALKLLSPALAGDADFRSRFVANARAAAALDHPHVLPVYEAGEHDGQLYLATRYVPELSLGMLIAREGPMPLQRAGMMLAQIASALDAAQSGGLVHGDVKPSNILIAAGEHAYLADFGLTPPTTASGAITRVGRPLVHVEYLAPELLDGSPATPRSDIYALGCTFVECLTGAPPPRSGPQLAAQHTLAHGPDPEMSVRRTGVPRELEPVIARALDQRPEDRYATATEFAAAVARAGGFAASAEPVATFVSASTPANRSRACDSIVQVENSRQRRLLRLVLTALASVVLFAGTAIALIASDPSRPTLTQTTPAPSGIRTGDPALSPTPAASPSTPQALVTLRAEELILPLSEFPFSGYTVPFEDAYNQKGWSRLYRSTALVAAPTTFNGIVEVWPTAEAAQSATSTWLVACPSASSTPLGDSSRACVRLQTAPASSSVSLLVITRNVSIVFVTAPSTPLLTEPAADPTLNELVTLAKAQLVWIDRVAPPDGSTSTRPSPAPTPRLVTLTAEQIVLPLADFPLPGYSIGADGVSLTWWYREFTNGRDAGALRSFPMQVYVLRRVLEAETTFAAWAKCDRANVASAQELATTVGDKSNACLYTYASGSQSLVLTALSRNVVLRVDAVTARSDGRVEELVAIARAQFAAIDRVAPR